MIEFMETKRRPGSPMSQVISSLIKRHGRWRVLRAALFAGHPLPRRKRSTAAQHVQPQETGLPTAKDLYPPSSGRDLFW